MEIILSSSCHSLTGELGKGYGYSIQNQLGRYFSKRNSKGDVPADGHWRFIVLCAEQSRSGLYIRDIRVGYLELIQALHEAGHHEVAMLVNRPMYNAEQLLKFKEHYHL